MRKIGGSERKLRPQSILCIFIITQARWLMGWGAVVVCPYQEATLPLLVMQPQEVTLAVTSILQVSLNQISVCMSFFYLHVVIFFSMRPFDFNHVLSPVIVVHLPADPLTLLN
jgi:hypothetical protein